MAIGDPIPNAAYPTAGQGLVLDWGGKVPSSAIPYLDGWITLQATLTYSSADGATGVATTSTDLTGLIPLGARLKLVQSTTGYFIVTAITATTITFWGGTDYTLTTAQIVAASYSLMKVPFGFNASPAKWQSITSATNSPTKAAPAQNTWYGDTALTPTGPSVVGHIGLWRASWKGAVQAVDGNSTGNVDIEATLSNASTTESNSNMTSYEYHSVLGGNVESAAYRDDIITLAAKTTLYVNIRTIRANVSQIALDGQRGPIVVRLECAYL